MANFHPRFDTLICYVERDVYLQIHAHCQKFDIQSGDTAEHIYDAPNGGGITVWNRTTFFEPKPSPEEALALVRESLKKDPFLREPRSSCCCTYRWMRTDGKDSGESVEDAPESQLHDDADEVEKVTSDTFPDVKSDVKMFKLGSNLAGMFTRGCDVLGVTAEPGYHLNIACDWSKEKDWTPMMAQKHFLALHRRVVGTDVNPDWVNKLR